MKSSIVSVQGHGHFPVSLLRRRLRAVDMKFRRARQTRGLKSLKISVNMPSSNIGTERLTISNLCSMTNDYPDNSNTLGMVAPGKPFNVRQFVNRGESFGGSDIGLG